VSATGGNRALAKASMPVNPDQPPVWLVPGPPALRNGRPRGYARAQSVSGPVQKKHSPASRLESQIFSMRVDPSALVRFTLRARVFTTATFLLVGASVASAHVDLFTGKEAGQEALKFRIRSGCFPNALGFHALDVQAFPGGAGHTCQGGRSRRYRWMMNLLGGRTADRAAE
jgi:hypothetical protein